MTLATSWKARTLSRRQFSSPRPKPTTTPAQRFAVGKEEQRNECALTFVKKSEQAIYSLLRRGDPAGIRTPDPLLKRQLLCRLSYRVMVLCSAAAATRIVWLGRLDSNQRMRESKSLALPLGDAPMWKEVGDRGYPDPLPLSGVGDGTRTHNARNHNPVLCQLNYTHHI